MGGYIHVCGCRVRGDGKMFACLHEFYGASIFFEPVHIALISSNLQLPLLGYCTRHLPCDISRKLHFEQEGDPNGGDTVTVRNAIDVTLWRLVPANSAHLPF